MISTLLVYFKKSSSRIMILVFDIK